MADNSDLFRGLEMLNDGIKQFKTGRAIERAQIEINTLNEAFRRKSISDIERDEAQALAVNNLAARMTSFGADANDTAMAFKALAPKPANSEEELFMKATMKKLGPGATYADVYKELKESKDLAQEETIKNQIRVARKKSQFETDQLIAVEKKKKEMDHDSYVREGSGNKSILGGLEVVPGWGWSDKVVEPDAKTINDIRLGTKNKASFLGKLKEYKEFIKAKGTSFVGDDFKKAAAMYEELKVDVKELKGLGQIMAADMSIIEGILPNSTSKWENVKSIVTAGVTTGSLVGVLDDIEARTNKAYNRQLTSMGAVPTLPRGSSNTAIRRPASEGEAAPTTRSRHVIINNPLAKKVIETSSSSVDGGSKSSIRAQSINKSMQKLNGLKGRLETLNNSKKAVPAKVLEALKNEIAKEQENLNTLKRGK